MPAAAAMYSLRICISGLGGTACAPRATGASPPRPAIAVIPSTLRLLMRLPPLGNDPTGDKAPASDFWIARRGGIPVKSTA